MRIIPDFLEPTGYMPDEEVVFRCKYCKTQLDLPSPIYRVEFLDKEKVCYECDAKVMENIAENIADQRIKELTGALDDLVAEHIMAGSNIADCVNEHLKAALVKAQKVLEK